MLPTKFRFIWPSGFRGEDVLEINQSETRIVCGGHVCKWIGTKWAIFIEDLPTKFWFIWPSDFRGEDFFRNQPIKNKNCLWRPCLLTDRDEMSILYRGHAIDASYQVSLHLAEGVSEEKIKMWKVKTTDAKWWQKLTLPLERWAKMGEGNLLFLKQCNRWCSEYSWNLFLE